MKVLPYKYSNNNFYYKRLIVEPITIPDQTTEEGLIIPSKAPAGSCFGKVFQSAPDSDFKPGDEVQYPSFERAGNENMDAVNIEGKVYDVIYEQKIWVHNDRPYNQIFVRPVSDLSASDEGLIIPSDVQSVTRKGIVYDAPEWFDVKKGDLIEYANTIQGRVPQARINDELLDVIYELDIFMINGKVAPYRMIVKIDKVQQEIKRNSTASGLKLSPLFIHMLRNLQYGEVAGIGEKAKEKYPMLKKGDTIIIDHGVESQDYRLVKYDLGKENNAIAEYRILNCYDFSDGEIFGKLHYEKKTKKIIDITPIGDSVFLKWEFNLFNGEGKEPDPLLLESADTLSKYHNLNDLKNIVGHQRAEAAERAKLKVSAKKQQLAYLNAEQHPMQYQILSEEVTAIEQEEGRMSAHLRKDHWVVCETIFPRRLPQYMISPYEVLYPINLLGNKYLIGHSDFLLFQSHKNMDITSKDLVPLSDNVLVLPIEDKADDGGLIIPDIARSKPQYGTVVKIVSDNALGVKDGDFVLFRQHAGLKQSIDGVAHLVMKQNDLLAVVPAKG